MQAKHGDWDRQVLTAKWRICRDKKEALIHMLKFSLAFEEVQSQNFGENQCNVVKQFSKLW